MKFVHIADMHFDSPFVNLSDKDVMGDLRRLEQRKVFKKVIEYIKQEKVEHLFIVGDLYEHQYVKLSTIEYINRLFQEIPETRIWIAPGNHDPYLKNSYYHQFTWSENVTIFENKITRVELPEMDIYGFGFGDFYCTGSGIENLEIQDKNKINVLLMHGTLDGASLEDKQYHSISKKMLQEKGFDYIALGHIHKPYYDSENMQKIVYPGSTVSLGFDELGKHGMIVGNLEKESLQYEFMTLDEAEFKEITIDMTDIFAKEDLIEKINDLSVQPNEYIKIILKGNRNFEINPYEILKLISNERIIKIKNDTKIAVDLEKLANENTLRGIFIKMMKEKLEEKDLNQEEKDRIEKAIEIGLDALK